MMEEGNAIIYVPAGAHVGEPILLATSRSTLVLGRGSRARISITHTPGGDGASFAGDAEAAISAVELAALTVDEAAALAALGEGGDCRVVVMPGAEVGVTQFGQMVDGPAFELSIRQCADSRVSLTAVTAGGAADLGWRVQLAEPRAEFELAGLYLASGDERAAFRARVEHLAPDCRSDQLIKGVAAGRGAGSFIGTVHVAPEGQRTAAMQLSRGVLLSPEARIGTQPRLEIYADDVKCNHGAAVGQLDEGAVYYMRQRGLDAQSARRLQLEGFAGEITSRATHGAERIGRAVLDMLEKM